MALRVIAAGPGATIQDGGRFGLLRYGVTPAGPMDGAAMRTANLALGNAADAAALEVAAGGLSLVCEDEPVTVAFAGGGFRWARDAAPLPAAARVRLRPGATLSVRAGAWGAFTYLAVPTGVDVAPVMGSRATHTRSRLGGLDGRMLAVGDRIPHGATEPGGDEAARDAVIDAPWLARTDTPLRVVLGPQDDHFTSRGIATFLDGPFTLTAAADRMAYKLSGATIAHVGDFNIVSDGVALGAVQVAGDGQPLVLMADRQPTGGYPKIAHVCRADIGRLAQLRPGETCRFTRITGAAARDALLKLEDALATTPARCTPLVRVPTVRDFLSINLISGVVSVPDDG